jgi:hypothetical protein
MLAAGWARLKQDRLSGRASCHGEESSPGSLALLCPVVAFSVLGALLHQ